MKLDISLGLLRHVLTAAGGALVAKGFASNDEMGEAAGAICTLIGVGWSVWHKWQGSKAGATRVIGLVLMGMMGGMGVMGCVSATATKTSKDGSSDSIKVTGFLEKISGSYSNGAGMTLIAQDVSPDQQSIAVLAGGVVELGKAGLALAARGPTNSVTTTTNTP
jgi:hypothetical protein